MSQHTSFTMFAFLCLSRSSNFFFNAFRLFRRLSRLQYGMLACDASYNNRAISTEVSQQNLPREDEKVKDKGLEPLQCCLHKSDSRLG